MVKKPASRRRLNARVGMLQPVKEHLTRMENLLLEVRYEQDVKLKRIVKLEAKIDELTERLAARRSRRR